MGLCEFCKNYCAGNCFIGEDPEKNDGLCMFEESDSDDDDEEE